MYGSLDVRRPLQRRKRCAIDTQGCLLAGLGVEEGRGRRGPPDVLVHVPPLNVGEWDRGHVIQTCVQPRRARESIDGYAGGDSR